MTNEEYVEFLSEIGDYIGFMHVEHSGECGSDSFEDVVNKGKMHTYWYDVLAELNQAKLRSISYDSEWLKSIGAIEDSTSPFALVFVIPSRHSSAINLLQCDDADNASDSPWSIKSTFSDGSVESAMIAEEIETRGDVLDLL